MSLTNAFTATAATQTVQTPLRPMRLLGLFQNDTNPYILMRTLSGETIRLSKFIPTHGLRLDTIGDGWAMVDDGHTLHRLVIG